MAIIIKGSILAAVVSVILGVISRITLTPFFVEAQAYLDFAQFCLLIATTFLLYKIAYKVEG